MEGAFKVVAAVLAIYLIIAIALYFGQRRVLYLPDRRTPDPTRAGVAEMRPVTLATEDGLDLLAWWRPPQASDNGTLVYFHGNGGHIGYRGYKLRPYLDAGLGVLIVSYRGYGGNPGSPTEEGLYADGRAALAFVTDEGIPLSKLVLYGESLGSGVAVHLAARTDVAAVVLEAPFTSIPDVAAHHYWWLPARQLIHDRYNSETKIDEVDAPVLILHGERDRVVPIRFGHALLVAASEPKTGVFFPEAGHEDLYEHGAARRVLDFLADLGLI